MRRAALLCGILLLIPTVSAAVELAVQGHTVFHTLETIRVERGWDIVVLVHEVQNLPNVLWFNDQWKTFGGRIDRYPCGGYVVVVPGGTGPSFLTALRTGQPQGPNIQPPATVTYRESYHITDPNGYVSDTHLYSASWSNGASSDAWITSLHNSWIDDDGTSACPPLVDTAAHKDPGSNGVPYHDSDDGAPERLYNADVFGWWAGGGGSKRHGEGAADNSDGTGCEAHTEWDCGLPDASGDEDGREGNSHPYNPLEPDAGRRHSHAKRVMDVYYFSENPAPSKIPPASPNWKTYDTEVVESEDSQCFIEAGYHEHCP